MFSDGFLGVHPPRPWGSGFVSVGFISLLAWEGVSVFLGFTTGDGAGSMNRTASPLFFCLTLIRARRRASVTGGLS